jgi:hypothetical protein
MDQLTVYERTDLSDSTASGVPEPIASVCKDRWIEGSRVAAMSGSLA